MMIWWLLVLGVFVIAGVLAWGIYEFKKAFDEILDLEILDEFRALNKHLEAIAYALLQGEPPPVKERSPIVREDGEEFIKIDDITRITP